jgi:hypothetical protein
LKRTIVLTEMVGYNCFIIFQYYYLNIKIFEILWKLKFLKLFEKFEILKFLKILISYEHFDFFFNFWNFWNVFKFLKYWNFLKIWTEFFFFFFIDFIILKFYAGNNQDYYTSLTSHWLRLNHMTWNFVNILWKLTQTGNN